MTQNTVVFMCGSFSPVTVAHLGLLKIVVNHTQSVLGENVLEARVSPVSDAYKKKGLVSAPHRIKMLELALSVFDFGIQLEKKIDTWESERDEYSTTIKVLEHVREYVNATYGPETKIRMACGADLLESMNMPGVWADEDVEMIIRNYNLCAISRPGQNIPATIGKHAILSQLKDFITVIEGPDMDLSSTIIRARIASGESISDLTPEPVVQYIRDQGLYLE
eukprot:TRINITY_DN2870_c0_g1_i1.p1 TRINITY_DN2870_c0_g1~~TRINITY_DN2870_c0_g1_i1.p1  ORF type:complete len:231 (-),score=72.63 TRINITY_DN2870_c0_g1_i1:46-711(-)